MSPTRPNRVLVIGATGGVGRLAVAAAGRHGLQVRAFARLGQ
jgi:NADPH:quinone reductase-like Zn-dependent oxidoreductase